MSKLDWQELLGWTDDQLEELRLSGFSFLRQGHYPKAIVFFKALCVLAPESSYDLQTLGALYLQVGETEDALAILNRALALEPNHEPTLLNKVKALFLHNQPSEALSIAHRLTTSTNSIIANNALALISTHV